MDRGYVKLWRKAFDNGLHRNHKAWALFTWIIGNATHKEMNYIAGNQKIHLMPGQIVTGRKRLAEELAMSVQNIRTCLQLLENIGFLTIKPTNKYSTLTVVNWTLYQSDSCKVTNKPHNDQPATNQHLTTKQECKNIRNNICANAQRNGARLDEFKNQFWPAYPKKKDKLKASQTWVKLAKGGKLPEIDTILSALESQKQSDQWKREIIPLPTTWLNGHRWEDETETKSITAGPEGAAYKLI